MKTAGSQDPVLTVINSSKIYDGAHAIKDINFDLCQGEVHALAGENGAGKSTLAKAISGAIELTAGKILFDGTEVSFRRPAEALKAGIAMVYQETSLVPTMTVAQNIFLGKEKPLTRLRTLYISAQQALQTLNFHVDPTTIVERLGAAQKQMVEIARAVIHDAKIIIFDEPTATLTPEEKLHFFDLIEFLKNRGVSIIFISHALEESLQIADRITVLRDAQLIITADAKTLTREKLVKYMVGRDLSQTHYARRHTAKTGSQSSLAKKLLTVENVIAGNEIKGMSFSVYAGEITGMAGLVGSGRTAIAKVIAGEMKRNLINGGMIYLDGRPIRYRVPTQAIDDGIVYLTEDRKVYGLFDTMDIEKNIYMGWLATKMGSSPLLNGKVSAELSQAWIRRLNIQALSKRAKIVELSGGNQQKVLVSKCMVQNPKLIIFDEPTRGVDVGAIQEIHIFIRSLAKEGIGILLISSYIPEVLSLSDRILVCRQGRVVEEFPADEATEEKIMFAAVH